MEITIAKIKPRLQITENRRTETLNFGKGNTYPQLIERLVDTSPTATQCCKMLSKFIRGGGFSNEQFNKEKVGYFKGKKLTVRKLLRLVSNDVAKHRGYALHVNRNLAGQITTITYVPFKDVRVGSLDDQSYSGKYLVSKDWDKPYVKPDFKTYHAFNDNIKVIHAQIESAGGIEKYKGQLLYESLDDSETYPKAYCDSVIKDMDNEAQIVEFISNTLNQGFMADYFLLTSENFEDSKEEEEEFTKKIEGFQGAENSGSIFHLNIENVEDFEKAFKLIKVEKNLDDKMFVNWEKLGANKIRKAFNNIPPVLVDFVEGKLGNTSGEQIKQATNFYNGMTSEEREDIQEVFEELFSKFNRPLNPSGDYSIIPFQLIDSEEEQGKKPDPAPKEEEKGGEND